MNLSSGIKNNRNAYIALVSLWLLFQMLWFIVWGLHFDQEAEKYINEASYLVSNGHFSQLRFLFYSATVLVIVISNFLHTGLYGAVIFLMGINLVAYCYFFKALLAFFEGSILKPLGIAGALMLFWPYQYWTLFLYSESFFYSSILLLLAHLVLYNRMSVRFIAITIILLLLVIFSRPLGVLFVVPVLLFVQGHLSASQKKGFYGLLIPALICIYFVIDIVFSTTSDWSMLKAIQSDVIIADKTDYPVNPNVVVSSATNPVVQLVFYLTHNLPHFLYLAVKRWEAFFLLYRNYFSLGHNLYLVLPVFSIYAVILLRFRRIVHSVSHPLLLFLLGSIVSFALAIAVQFDDYHNRFFLALMPLWVLLAAAGVFSFHIRKQ